MARGFAEMLPRVSLDVCLSLVTPAHDSVCSSARNWGGADSRMQPTACQPGSRREVTGTTYRRRCTGTHGSTADYEIVMSYKLRPHCARVRSHARSCTLMHVACCVARCGCGVAAQAASLASALCQPPNIDRTTGFGFGKGALSSPRVDRGRGCRRGSSRRLQPTAPSGVHNNASASRVAGKVISVIRKRYTLAATRRDTLCPLPSGHSPSPFPVFPHPFSFFRPPFAGGWFQSSVRAACTTTAWARVLRV
eukprot:scaffold3808_cov112-Isochrysis_galbana.AAC.23